MKILKETDFGQYLERHKGEDENKTRADKEFYKSLSIRVIKLAVELFNRDKLDAITLWERIGSGIDVAYSKNSIGDIEGFTEVLLKHILADVNKTVSSNYPSILSEFSAMSDGRKKDVMNYLYNNKRLILTLTKIEWDKKKGR